MGNHCPIKKQHYEIGQKDLELILESLKYTKIKFEDYEKYPSYDYKQERINEINEVIGKV